MWHQATEKPESGRRIVAIYGDGSGAALFLVHDFGIINQDGEDCDSLGKDFVQWAYLPDGFRTWIEDNLD
jgi:hypothetical protein